MATAKDTLLVIPARLGSSRLPNKPLALISGKEMILWVLEQAARSSVNDIIIACEDIKIKEVVEKHGRRAVMTSNAHLSGTDRIMEALEKIDSSQYKYVFNLQGDLPFIPTGVIDHTLDLLRTREFEITTAAYKICDKQDKISPDVVKAIIAEDKRALYFTRAPSPYNGQMYKHIGVYAYTIQALQKFTSYPQSTLEKAEKLEQLRALENRMSIGVTIEDSYPISVDTAEDLELARQHAHTITGTTNIK